DAAYPAEGCLVPTGHQLGKEFERIREVEQLLTITLQGKVPRLDKGTVQDAQQSGLNRSGCEIGHGIPSRHDLNLGKWHANGLAWRSQRLYLSGRDGCPSRRRRQSCLQSGVWPPDQFFGCRDVHTLSVPSRVLHSRNGRVVGVLRAQKKTFPLT